MEYKDYEKTFNTSYIPLVMKKRKKDQMKRDQQIQ